MRDRIERKKDGGCLRALIGCVHRVQIQKEVIPDLKRENQFLSKEIRDCSL
jgi:hypothetical protein